MEKEKIEDGLTYKIIGCAMKVHGTLGNGFQEVIYQRALAIEMRNGGLLFSECLGTARYFCSSYSKGEALFLAFIIFLIVLMSCVLVSKKRTVFIIRKRPCVQQGHLKMSLPYFSSILIATGILITSGSGLSFRHCLICSNRVRFP